jgi:uncharacterized protein YwqG
MSLEKKAIRVPDFLSKYATELVKLQRSCLEIKAIPQDEDLLNDPLAKTQSKFLGEPFFPTCHDYPVDKHGCPMILIAQINFSEIPKLENYPSSGLLQLYFSAKDWWDSDSTKIIFIDDNDLQKEPLNDFSFINNSDYEELPISKIHKLHFKDSIDTGSGQDSQFSFHFGEYDYWDFEETLNDQEEEKFYEYFSHNGHKIGGYANFTQDDPRDYESTQKDDLQILQIDIDDFIMFGDSGVGHIFISPKYLEDRNFDNAYFHWDCC